MKLVDSLAGLLRLRRARGEHSVSPPPAATIMPSLAPNFIFRGARLAADYQPAQQFFGLVDAFDAREDTVDDLRRGSGLILRAFAPDVFGLDHSGDAKIDLGEFIESDL